MRTIATTLAAMLAVLLALPAFGQTASLARVCESAGIPTRAQYDSNPGAYADNFCALATYAPHRAARQFNSMITLVRAHDNPNRLYWDRRFEPDDWTRPIQLLRPWMTEQNYGIRWLKAPQFGVEGEFTRIAFVANADDNEDSWRPTFTLRIEDRGHRNPATRPTLRYYRTYLSWNGRERRLHATHLGNSIYRYRFDRGDWSNLDATLTTTGVHIVLDCLEDQLVLSGANSCDVTIDHNALGVGAIDHNALSLANAPLLE